MFEIDDVKLGRAKVVSITEARQAMATIMTDREFSYIITKNNEPVRVIVNYETLKKFQVLDEAPTSHYEPQVLPGTPMVKPAKPNRSLRGLLKEREDDLKKQSDEIKNPVQSHKKAVNESSFRENEGPIEFRVPEKKSAHLVLEESGSAEIEELTPETPFSRGGQLLAHEAESEESGRIEASPTYAETSSDYEGDFFGSESELPPPEDELIAQPETIESSAEVEAEAEIEAEPVSDEDKDYFKRFQKLYKADTNAAPIAPKATHTPEESTTFASISQPKRSEPIQESAPEPEIVSKRKTNEFPSIDDLLRELEETKLTDEE